MVLWIAIGLIAANGQVQFQPAFMPIGQRGPKGEQGEQGEQGPAGPAGSGGGTTLPTFAAAQNGRVLGVVSAALQWVERQFQAVEATLMKSLIRLPNVQCYLVRRNNSGVEFIQSSNAVDTAVTHLHVKGTFGTFVPQPADTLEVNVNGRDFTAVAYSTISKNNTHFYYIQTIDSTTFGTLKTNNSILTYEVIVKRAGTTIFTSQELSVF